MREKKSGCNYVGDNEEDEKGKEALALAFTRMAPVPGDCPQHVQLPAKRPSCPVQQVFR